MSEKLIGRIEEKSLLLDTLASTEAELVAVFGRRRVGKTFLVRNAFNSQIVFECTGIHDASLKKQLENFNNTLRAAGYPVHEKRPSDWLEAFQILIGFLKTINGKKRKVLFFDEFPWLHTHRSGFVQAFGHFWNTWASRQENLVVVICGSAASWMIRHVVNDRGGLHNRVTRKIRLLPFTLAESETYFRSRGIILDKYQLLQLYMVMGGIPQYLKEVRKGESSAQAIDRICFTRDGFLHDEFRNLYSSLFETAGKHIEVIRALANKTYGLTRNEIIDSCKLTSGGSASLLLGELEQSGFISLSVPFGKTRKETIYRLTDEYSHFYIKYMEHGKSQGTGSWIKLSRESSWKSWSGYAFESICIKHIRQLKKALEIGAVYTEVSNWSHKPVKEDKGAQIDLIIDRQDMCINICEVKFSTGEFVIDKKYFSELENKLTVFGSQSKTKKTLFLTMISTYGVKNNEYKSRIVQNEVTMHSLFVH